MQTAHELVARQVGWNGDDHFQLVRVERLGAVDVEAGVARPALVGLLAMAGIAASTTDCASGCARNCSATS